MTDRHALTQTFMQPVTARNSGQDTFLQAVEEVAADVLTIEKNNPDYATAKVLERLTEPDRVISFRVTWVDDAGDVQINRGWRVQTCNAIGPYKGGLRFHPSVTLSDLKFLGFEQVFKNALTGLPLGGGKGGADFDPSGRSDGEIMRFCQAFMTELSRYIGPDMDVPAGDINVGTREIGYLFGAYKSLKGQFEGAITGKGMAFGGSAMRVEATGYGLIYFIQAMLDHAGDTLSGKRIAISGKGNVATHAAEKAICEDGIVVTLSDTSGTLIADDGFSQDAVDWVRTQKQKGADISDPPAHLNLSFEKDALPWDQSFDIALPCATQNEIDANAAHSIINAGAIILAEGANMPLTADALDKIAQSKITYAPGKASNAGGVAISGLEMSQNAHGQFESADAIDQNLKKIMQDIHARAAAEGREDGKINYRRGANVAAYRKVADAITAFGVV
ncbi:NADP-specific glutamate dehydrogenase [Nereida sp. MMG025]|uniref:NADP-specific glutamate dehydrogenase n=1 Tax=Nereida sp. MMG025 TaxID=2909981 RepID=UPI001F0293E5|nr:NADP-specific glutamate dehydrogenase [Nereida sp. MMG025]MCF6445848.1 NADP-specific glutamate dehydrogenase [Nereida sp. MMG025]